ncbi:polyprenyl synthetase family protein [Nocardiopsis sp. NPDC050513]|uniref:polyprenyl synthetase family protein n=1 Tax=Nocardiopsis sp. NPDC050513 TaxID=3364338 RepID=UPI0037AB7B14
MTQSLTGPVCSDRAEGGESPDIAALEIPRQSTGLEWWWFNAHLDGDDGGSGLVFYFVRHRAPTTDGSPLDSHAVAWFRSDPGTAAHVGESWLDEGAVRQVRDAVATDRSMDARVRRALTEALEQGRGFQPDRVLPGPVRVDPTRLDLDYGVARLSKDGDAYLVEADGAETGFALRLTPLKPAVHVSCPHTRLGSGSGITHASFVPRLAVSGTVRTGGRTEPVRGDGWYEHAFGDTWYRADGPRPAEEPEWTWAGLRLDNGWEVSACERGRPDASGGRSRGVDTWAVAVAPDGRSTEAPARLASTESWTSLATLNTYGTAWEVEVPGLELRLRARAWFPHQEVRSLFLLSGMVEAHVRVEGTMAGRPVRGRGLCEVFPSSRVADFERYVTRVRDVTLDEIDRLYPARPDRTLVGVAGSEDRPERLDAVVVDDLHRSLVEPMRHATRGLGRSWRSYVVAAVIEICGGDSERYRPLLAATELMHTGCLVVDDVQDASPVRRGRESVHTVFGEPTAINAGTNAYFAFDRVLREVLPDDDRLRLRVYQTYLRVLRAGHAGQALDIAGHAAAMDTAVATGDPSTLLRRLHTVHRFKTGVPVAGLAEMGALITGADEHAIAAMGDYFETVGLAYQISDDVMDLRGVTVRGSSGERRRTKHTAEDLHAGKVTMPLAHAVGRVPAPRLREIWHAIRGGDADTATVAAAVADLEAHGAVDACTDEARLLVDEAWKPLQDLVAPSWHTVMMRALGHYCAQREAE